jgi:hypothetical protein
MRISFSLRLIFLMMLSSPMVLEATGEIERERCGGGHFSGCRRVDLFFLDKKADGLSNETEDNISLQNFWKPFQQPAKMMAWISETDDLGADSSCTKMVWPAARDCVVLPVEGGSAED